MDTEWRTWLAERIEVPAEEITRMVSGTIHGNRVVLTYLMRDGSMVQTEAALTRDGLQWIVSMTSNKLGRLGNHYWGGSWVGEEGLVLSGHWYIRDDNAPEIGALAGNVRHRITPALAMMYSADYWEIAVVWDPLPGWEDRRDWGQAPEDTMALYLSRVSIANLTRARVAEARLRECERKLLGS